MPRPALTLEALKMLLEIQVRRNQTALRQALRRVKQVALRVGGGSDFLRPSLWSVLGRRMSGDPQTVDFTFGPGDTKSGLISSDIG